MSSFLVFDSKGGEFRGPKASINNLQVVMVRESEDSGLWISLCNGENLYEARLKSIIPHGDNCKGKMSFYVVLQVVSFSII